MVYNHESLIDAYTIVPSKLRNDRFYKGHICVRRDHNSLQAACEKLQVSVRQF
jgi:hypothetical protein